MPGSKKALAGDAGGEFVEFPVGGCVVVLQLARSLSFSLSELWRRQGKAVFTVFGTADFLRR